MVKASLSRLNEPSPNLRLDAMATIAEFPGAALLVAADGRILDANARSHPLQQELERLDNVGKREGLTAVIRDAALSGAPLTTRILLARNDGEDAGQQAFDITLLPLTPEKSERPNVLILGVEATLQRNLARALKSSRDLFRDLVLCSSDFAWETDRRGVFVYVGPRGAAGFAAEALHGRSAFGLQASDDDAGHAAIKRIFLANEAQEDEEVWIMGADGTQHCFLVSAMPVYDAGNLWCGARGIGRDVTKQRLQEKALAENKARSDLIRSIVDTIRKETDPVRMLQVSAEAIGRACKAKSCWVLETKDGTHFTPSAEFHSDEAVVLPQHVCTAVGGRSKTISYPVGDLIFEARRTSLYGEPNGAVCTARLRDDQAEGFAAQVLDQIADHAAVVVGQAQNLIQLTRLSRTDPLTGLLNRRAFDEELVIRLARHSRYGRTAGMIYLDVDNFKQINDEMGHGKGDDLLKNLAGVLARTARNTDLLVRFGGDEFGLFLDETEEDEARLVTHRVLEGFAQLPRASEDDPDASISIGLAIWRPEDREPPHDLVARADAALYAAKKGGKGRLAVAPAKEVGIEPTSRMHSNGV